MTIPIDKIDKEKVAKNSLALYNQLKSLGMEELAEAFKYNTFCEQGIDLNGIQKIETEEKGEENDG